jgi:hypothetical protein
MQMLEDLQLLERRLESDLETERWSAAAALGEYVFEYPDRAWPLVVRFGSSDIEDTRQAIATCVLEHILEHHFEAFFPLLEAEIAKGNENLIDTLQLCSKFGQSLEPSHTERWESFLARSRR